MTNGSELRHNSLKLKGERMNDLVITKHEDIFTDSMVIAEGTGIRHDKIKVAIRKHESKLCKFGKLSTSYGGESTGGRRLEVYNLNEQQSTFLITLLKNTDVVIDFKVRLVQEFFKMRQALMQRQTTSWVESRQQSKLTRQSETDVLKDLVEYAELQGSTHANKYYMIYSKLANRKAKVNNRDTATILELNNLNLIESIILKVVRAEMNKETHYKEIYKACNDRLNQFLEIAYLTA